MASRAKTIGDLIAADASVAIPGDGVVLASDLADGSVTTAKLADANVTIDKIATTVPLGTKNLIINGDMRIAQRGTSASGLTGSAYNTIDRMYTSISNGGTWTQSQDTDVPTGQGFATSLKMDCTTADASLATTDRVRIEQYIEAQMLQHIANGTANAKSLTLSFWVKSNKTGTYTVSFYKWDNTARAVGKTYTINSADTWEKKTITFNGDTSGGGIDNNNDRGLAIYFWLASGPDYTSGTFSNGVWENYTAANWVSSSQVNLADNTSNYINITGVQLEVGDTATPFEHRPYDMELARCQRYYYKNSGSNYDSLNGVGNSVSSSASYVNIPFPVAMRNEPSASFSNIVITDRHVYDAVVSAFSGGASSEFGAHLLIDHSAVATADRPAMLCVRNGYSGYIAFESEL